MTVSKGLLSAAIALALVPAAAQAAGTVAAAKTAPAISPAAQSLSLVTPVRAGAKTGKKSHALIGIPVIFAVLGGAAIAAGIVAAAGGFNGNGSPASP